MNIITEEMRLSPDLWKSKVRVDFSKAIKVRLAALPDNGYEEIDGVAIPIIKKRCN
jgi:uncharacterized protein YdaT